MSARWSTSTTYSVIPYDNSSSKKIDSTSEINYELTSGPIFQNAYIQTQHKVGFLPLWCLASNSRLKYGSLLLHKRTLKEMEGEWKHKNRDGKKANEYNKVCTTFCCYVCMHLHIDTSLVSEELLAAKKQTTQSLISQKSKYQLSLLQGRILICVMQFTWKFPSDWKRKQRCGECPGCTLGDCNICKIFLDKNRNWGSGLKKQYCRKRRCVRTVKNIDKVIFRLSQFRDEHGMLNMLDIYVLINGSCSFTTLKEWQSVWWRVCSGMTQCDLSKSQWRI